MNRRSIVLTLLSGFCIGLSACTIYKPLPLNQDSLFLNDVSHVSVDRSALSLPELRDHPFDPSDGLDMTEVAMLAVANSPDLRIARDQTKISHAQAFAAGLLPDPQLALSRDIPVNKELDLTKAFSVGLSYDLGALISYASNRKAAEEAAHQADLDLLWQEWQIVAQARLLFSRLLTQQKVMALLQSSRSISAARYEQMQRALARGNVTADTANTDLATLQTTQTSLHDMEQQIQKSRNDLNALLGLKAEVELKLVDDEQLPQLDVSAVQQALQHLDSRRPDLLALHAGYESQEAKFRQAVLAQFPALNLSLGRARDTSDIYTKNLGLTLSLPIFNRNRGNIAIEQATRQRLHDEYQLRLNAAENEVNGILMTQEILERQLDEASQGEVVLKQAATHAESAYQSRAIDSLAYSNLRNAWLAKQVEIANLRQTLIEQRIALLTLMGGELPTAHKD